MFDLIDDISIKVVKVLQDEKPQGSFEPVLSLAVMPIFQDNEEKPIKNIQVPAIIQEASTIQEALPEEQEKQEIKTKNIKEQPQVEQNRNSSLPVSSNTQEREKKTHWLELLLIGAGIFGIGYFLFQKDKKEQEQEQAKKKETENKEVSGINNKKHKKKASKSTK